MNVLDVIWKAIAKFSPKYFSLKTFQEQQLVVYFILRALLNFNGLNLVSMVKYFFQQFYI